MYEELEEAGQLIIKIDGNSLDVYTLGVLQINLHYISNKVAYWLLSQEGILEPTWRRPKYLSVKRSFSQIDIIKVKINEVKAGSWYESVRFFLATALAEPDIRAILQNLAANIIWAIGASGIRGIVTKPEIQPPKIYPPLLKRQDPIEIGPNLRETIMSLSQNNNKGTLKFEHESNQEKIKVEIKIN